jgi:hypothetical protein
MNHGLDGLGLIGLPQSHVVLVGSEALDNFRRQRSGVGLRELPTNVGQLPEPPLEARRVAVALQAIMSPTSAILVNGLHAAWQKFRSVLVSKAQSSGRSLVSVLRERAFRMRYQVSKNGLNEAIVGWYGHIVATAESV